MTKKHETRITLVKLRVPRSYMSRWREIGILFGILALLGLVIFAIFVAQYVSCRMSNPPISLEKCIRPMAGENEERPARHRK